VTNNLIHKTLKWLAIMALLLLAGAPAVAQTGNVVYAGTSSELAVEEFEGVTYTWELYNDVAGLNLAAVPGNCPETEAYFVDGVNVGSTVEVMWLVPGFYFFKVTADDGCSNNIKVGIMEVLESYSYAVFLQPDSICVGETAVLTLEITEGIGPWDVTFTDGVTTWTITGIEESPYSFELVPSPSEPGSYEYWVTSVSNGYGMTNDTPTDPVILIVHPRPVTSPIYRYTP
jgi:hypothetical protein